MPLAYDSSVWANSSTLRHNGASGLKSSPEPLKPIKASKFSAYSAASSTSGGTQTPLAKINWADNGRLSRV
jgi:hypothetical protein